MSWQSETVPQNAVPQALKFGADRAESPAFSVLGEAGTVGGGAPLGNTAKSVDQLGADRAAKERRAVAFRLQRTAAAILPDERVGLCRWAVVSRQAGVDIHLTEYDGGAVRASFAGLQTCGSVWLCPCCGRRISETRRAELNTLLAWARERGVIIAADECYLGLCWEGKAPSILDPAVCDGDTSNILAIHSLSKTSNMASYRSGFVEGDPSLIQELLTVRKHAGFMVPTVIQSASAAALRDDRHVHEQYDRYRQRRQKLKAAVESAGMRVDDSAAGLYLWTTNGTPCRELTHWFAERGILVAPGEFYGPRGAEHVRIALTATDERIDAACERLQP